MKASKLSILSFQAALASVCMGSDVVVSGKAHVGSAMGDLTSISIPNGAEAYESALPMPLVSYSFDDRQAMGRNSGSLNRDLKIPVEGIVAATGKFGGALRFDGATRFQTRCQGLPAGNTPFSIAVWLCPEAGGENGGVCSWGQRVRGQSVGFGLQSGNGNFFFYGSDFKFKWPTGFSGSAWVHCLCVWDPSAATGHKRQVYLNGALAAYDDPDFTPNLNLSPDNSLYIGNVLAASDRNFKGRIDDLRIYSCALTAAQASVMAAGMPTGEDFIPATATVSVAETGVLVNELSRQTIAAVTGNGTVETAAGAKTRFDISSPAETGLALRGVGMVEKTGSGKLAVGSLQSGQVCVKEGELEVGGAVDLSRHVVAHWTFDSADPGRDSSGNGYRLIPSKGEDSWTELVSANPGAVTFAGATDVNTLVLNPFASKRFASSDHTDFPSGNAAFSVSVRVKPDPGQKHQKCGIYSWGVAASGQINALRTSGTDSSSEEFGYLHYNWGNDLVGYDSYFVNNASVYDNVWDDQWHHVVVTYDPQLPRRRIYADGMLLAEDAPGNMSVALSDFAIGMSRGSGESHNYWKGAIDDFMILDCAVTPEQVPLLATGGLSSALQGQADLVVEKSATLSVASGKTVSAASVTADGAVCVEGTLSLGGTSAIDVSGLSGNGTIAARDGCLSLVSDGNFPGAVQIGGGAQVVLGEGSMAVGRLIGDGSAVKKGPGDVVVSDASQLPSEVVVDQGTLVVANSPAYNSKLVAHWSFEGDDPLADDDGRGFRFAPTSGDVADLASDIPGAMRFGGSSYLRMKEGDVDAFPKGNDAFTVAAWVIPDPITQMGAKAYLGVWSWGTPRTKRAMNAFTFFNDLSGQLSGAPGYQHYAWSADKSISTSPDDAVFSGDKSNWHQIVVTYESVARVRSIYVDGVLKGSDTLADDLNVAIGTINLGAALATGTDRPFKGYIGDFAVYRTALSAEDVRSSYLAGESGGDASKTVVEVAEDAAFVVESGVVAVKSVECCGRLVVKEGAELVLASNGDSYLGVQELPGTVRVCDGARVTLGRGCRIGCLEVAANGGLTVELNGLKEAGKILEVDKFDGDASAIVMENVPRGWKVKYRFNGSGMSVSLVAQGFITWIR